MSDRRRLWRFIVERLIPAGTGGYTYYRDRSVIIFLVHTLLFAFLSILPIALFNISFTETIGILHPILTMVIWLVIKLINYQVHSSFDKNSTSDEEVSSKIARRDEETQPPPFGISQSIWNIRDRITDFSNIDINTLVVELISEGYNSNEIFHFFEVYQSGQLSLIPPVEREVSEYTQIQSPTPIHIFCCPFNVNWSRKDLENWFDRPFSLIEVIVAPMLSCVCGLLCFLNCSFVTYYDKIFFIVATASAQFSLLKAPNPDSTSTTMQDPWVPYSRAFHMIAYQFLFSFLTYMSAFRWVANAKIDIFDTTVSFRMIIKISIEATRLVIDFFPVINMIGMEGSIKDSWFVVIEVLQKLLLGKSGAITFYSANIQFIIDTAIISLLTAGHAYSTGDWAKNLMSAAAVVFGYVLSVVPNHIPFFANACGFENRNYVVVNEIGRSHALLMVVLRSMWAFALVYMLLFFDDVGTKTFLLIASCFLIATSLVTHTLLPRLAERYPFGIWSERMFEINDHYRKYISVMYEIERFILIPVVIASIISQSKDTNFGFMQAVESLICVTLITGITCTALRTPSRFAFVLTLNCLTNQYFTNSLIQTLVFIVIFIKLDEFGEKLSYIFKYSSFHSLTSFGQVIAFAAMIANMQFTIIGMLIATFLVAPMIPVLGYPIFLPSFPRPSIFWVNQIPYESRPGDALFYKSLSDSLAERIANDINMGRIAPVTEGQFFLLADDYFNAIVQIISTGLGTIVFQLRGLEGREQTLCHRNELQVIRSDIESADEIRTFMFSSIVSRITHPFFILANKVLKLIGIPDMLTRKERAFIRSCTWRTVLDDYKLEGYSVSANRIDQIFPDRHHQNLLYVNLIRVLTISIKLEDMIEIPDDFDYSPPQEVLEILGTWIEDNGCESIVGEILSIAFIIIKEMNLIPGGFDLKLHRFFSNPSLFIQKYQWISKRIHSKIIKCFRNAVSLAVFDASMALPDETNELRELINKKLTNDTVLPESHPRWEELIIGKEVELETIRQIQEPEDVVVKYMMFTRKEQLYRLVELNGEEVRGIWAGQIQETVYMESTDRERSSIQFDAFTLRNILSQSANPPIGYPEVICPISFSFADVL